MSSSTRNALIATRVSSDEHRFVRIAASLEGQTITQFLRSVAVPAALQRLEAASQEGFTRDPLTPTA